MSPPSILRKDKFSPTKQVSGDTLRLICALAVLGISSAPAALITWNGASSGGTWDTTNTNWNTATSLPWNSSNGASNIAQFDTSALTLNVGTIFTNGILFTQSATLSGGNITLAGTTPTITGAGSIGSVLLGTGGFTKAGAGTLTLTGTNTYTGTTKITGGTLAITTDANLGTAPVTATAGSLVIEGGIFSTSGTWTLNANRGIAVGLTSGLGTGTIDVASGELTYNGIIANNGGSSTGSLVKTGTGTLTLGGANTYSGNTVISAGTLKIANIAALPSGVGKGDLIANATLDLNGNSISVNGLSGAGTITSSAIATVVNFSAGSSSATTFNGILQNGSGTLGFTKIGTGTLTLSGNNTFTGGVIINAGTLQLGNVGALNSASPNSVTFGASAPATTKLQLNGTSVTIGALATNATPGTVVIENANASAATLTVNQATNTTFAGVLQDGTGGGALSLTKTGAGILTLGGTNTYSGNTTISAGTIKIANASAIPSGIGRGNLSLTGSLDLNGISITLNGLTGAGGISSSIAGAATLTVGANNATSTYDGVISNGSGTVGLTKTGTGTVTVRGVNTYTGATLIKNGVLALGTGNDRLPTGTVVTLGDGTTNDSGVLMLDSRSQTISGLQTAGSGVSNRVINGNATVSTLTVNNTSNYTFSGTLGGSTANDNNFNLVKSGTGTLTLSGTNTYSGSTTINAGIVSASNLTTNLGTGLTAVALSGGGALSYSGNDTTFTRGITVSASGGQVDTATSGRTLTLSTGNVTITSTGTFTVGGLGNTIISSNITGASGGILTKIDTGNLTLSGTNTYTGATNIRNGAIILGANSGVNSTATVTLGDSSTNTSGTLRLNGFTQTVSGLATAGSGVNNRVTGGNATLSTLTINNSGASTFSGILGGSGTNDNNLALTKSGAGVLTLSGTNTYTGGTTITAGTIAISLAANIGATAGNLSIGNATLQATNNITSARNIALTDASSAILVDAARTYTMSGNLTGVGALNLTGSGTLLVSGNANSYSGGTNIRSGTLTLGAANTLPTGTIVTLGNLTVSGILRLNAFSQTIAGLTMSGTGTANRVVNGNVTSATLTINNPANSTFAGILGGTGTNENTFGITKSGAGDLTLSGINTYTGTTRVSGGTLILSGGAAIADTAAVTLDNTAGAILQLNTSETIGSLAGGGITGGNVNLQNFTLTTGDASNTTYSGTMSGTGNLTKVGTGIFTLSGANTYSGTTTVTAGTLRIGNTAAIPSGIGKGNLNLTGTLDLNGNSITLNGLSLAGGITSTAAGNLTLSVGGNDQTTTYSGIMANGSATTLALTKIGTGVLTISGLNTYNGDTTISAGTLRYGGNNAIANGVGRGNVIISSGATLDLNGRTSGNALINGLSGSGTVTNTFLGTTAVITVGNADATSTFTGNISNGTGLVSLTKAGTGTLTLTPDTDNAFTGNVTINAGIIRAGNANALNSAGTNTVTFGASALATAKLQINGNNITIAGLQTNTTVGSPIVENGAGIAATLTINNTANFTYASAINDGSSGAFSLIKTGVGTQTLTGTSTYTGGTTINGGILAVSRDAALGATSGNLTIGNGKLQVTAAIASSPRNIVLTHAASTILVDPTFTYTNNSVISGSGMLNKEGLGTFQVTGDKTNTYNGGTTVKAGLLDIVSTSGTSLGQDVGTNNITVDAGGNLSLSSTANKGGTQTITVNSNSGALGGIGFSSTSLTQAQLTGMFTDSTGSFGGVLGINNNISYSSSLNLATFGSGAGQGYWFLGSGSTGTYTNASLTVGAANTYRLGGGGGTLTLSATNVLTGNNDVLVGSVSTNGSARVIVSGTQNYTGITTVTGGAILSIGFDTSLGTAPGSPTAGKLVLNGGTLQGRATTTLNANRGIAVGPTSGSGTGTIDTNGNSMSYAGIIANNGAGTGSFTKVGAGTLTLTGNANTYTGATNINGGTLNFSGINDLGLGTAINFGAATAGGTLQYAVGNTTDITARTVTFGTNGGTIDTNGNNVSFANATFGTGTFSKSGDGTLTLNAVNTMGAITISRGTLKLGVASAIPSTSALTLNGGATTAGTLDINGFDTTILNLTGTSSTVLGQIINSAVGSNKILTVNSTSITTFAGLIRDNTGSGGTIELLKTGASTLTLSGSNTYSGGTTIATGGITISGDSALGAVPVSATPDNITIASGATLGTVTNSFTLNSNRGIAIDGNTAAILAPGTGLTLTYNGIIANTGATTGGLTKSNTTGTLILGGANTYAGDTTISGGVLQINNAAAIPFGAGKGNVSIASANSGAIDLNGYDITINGLTGAGTIRSNIAGPAGITVGGNNATSSFTGVILNGHASSVVSLGKIGTGTLTLSGVNTYTGTTTISGGVLSISSDTNLGTAPGSATPGKIVINGGTLTTSATMTLNANRGIAVGPTSGSGVGTLAPAAGTTLTYSGIIANNGGTGGLTKTNTTGTLVLGGANTYSGDTTVAGGTLQLANVAAIPSGSGKGNLTLAAGSTLDLNNLSPTVNGLTGAGSVTNSGVGAVTFTAGGNNASGNFSGIIQDGNGVVAFTKTGTGRLILSGANTYSGNTTIDVGGTLEITGASALPSGLNKGNVILNGALALNSNLTINGLSGTGTIATDTASAILLTAGSNDQTSTFSGNISNGIGGGSLALTKTGLGTLTLAGNNTYSGATTISSGTLSMGSNTGLSASSSLTINSGTFLDVNGFSVSLDALSGTGSIINNGASPVTLNAGAGGGSSTFGGVIADGSNTLSLTKSGAGSLTLTGVNTYSGTTTIANGTISVAILAPGSSNLGTSSAAIVLGSGATKGTLAYTGNADLTLSRGFTVNAGGGEVNITTLGRTLTLDTGAIATSGTFTVAGSGTAVVSSVISGSGGFTKANTGTLTLNATNTYSGDTTVSTGTLRVTNAAAIPSGTGKGNVALNGSSILDVNNLSLTLNGLSGSGTVTNSQGSPVTLTVGGNDASGNFTGIIENGSGIMSLTKIGTGLLTLGGVNTYSGNTTLSEGTIQYGNASALPSGSGKGNVSIASAGILDLNNFAATLNGLSGTGLVTNNSGASTITVGANDQTSTFSGNIQDGLGTIGLTKTGIGQLTLAGNNTFSGATLISQGTLSMGSSTGLSSSSTLTIGNAGALDLNGQVIAIDGLAGNGSITNNNATPVTLTIGSSGGNGTFAGTINNGTGVIGLVKSGSGTITLSQINSYSGGTVVTGGLLGITTQGALGAVPVSPTPGNIVLNGGGISAVNSFEIYSNRGITIGPASGSGTGILDAALNQTLTYNGIIADNGSGTGGLTKTGLGTVALGGSNTYSGDTTVSAGSLQVASSTAIPFGIGKGNLVLNSTLDLNNISIVLNGLSGTGTVTNTKSGPATLSIGANDTSSTFAGVLNDGNGISSLTKVGTGTLTLTSTSSTYTGATTISAGTIAVSQDANLGASNSLLFNAGGTLSATETFTLNSSRGIGLSASASGNISVASTKTLTYGGVIADNGGSGGLTKNGAGTLILLGASTFTGATVVDQGVLVVNGSIASSSSISVNAGATVAGTGHTAAMTVQSGGVLSPGELGNIGTLGVSGQLTLGGAANFALGTSGTSHASPGLSDRVNVTGNVIYGGTLNLIDNANTGGKGSPGAGSYLLMTYTGASSGAFASVTGMPEYHVGLQDITAEKSLYVDLYNYAIASVTPAVDLGRIHAGGSFQDQTLTVANTAEANADFTETLGGTFDTPTSGVTATGSVTGLAGSSTNTTGMTVGISDNSAGAKSGSVAVNFTSQAFIGSGLSNTTLAPQNVAVTGFVYSGQGVWNSTGGGSWGNNTNDYNRWTLAGGTPGLDGILSANDTATFGNAITAPATVSLNGASPSLKSVTFNSANSYTLATGTSGTLILNGNGGNASVTATNGSHQISAPIELASNATFSVTNSGDTLTVSAGGISGNFGITKSGAGKMVATGNSTYTGNTSIEAGILLVNGTLGNTATAVSAGATLGGTGTVGGNVTVNGTLAPGDFNSIGTLGLKSLTLNNTLSIQWNGITDAIDRLNITDLLELTGTSTVNFSSLDGILTQSAYVFVTYGTLSSSLNRFATLVNLPTDYVIEYNYGGLNQIALVAIPEPAPLMLLAIGLAFAVGFRRRSNAKPIRRA